MPIIADDAVKAAPRYNEAEIRFHVVDPIVRSLGYPSQANTYLNLEQKLEYPYMHIGRRSKKDLPLGFPDYRAGLKGARGSFIIEAKAGNALITQREIEQAHSYAAHSQVGANYFVLCNGEVISVYETLSGATSDPIVSLSLDVLNERFHEIENILSPSNLYMNCKIIHDSKLKISEGLKSSVKIRDGHYRLFDYSYRFIMNGQDCTDHFRRLAPQISLAEQQLELMKTAFELRVSGGMAERGADGQITARVEFKGATIHNHQAMAILGITEVTFATADKFISNDPNSPTIFESLKDFGVLKGTSVPQMFGGALVMEEDIKGNMFIKVAISYNNGKIDGQYIALAEQNLVSTSSPPVRVELEFSGPLELLVDI